MAMSVTNQELTELNSALSALGAQDQKSVPLYKFTGLNTLHLAQLRKWASEQTALLTGVRNNLIRTVSGGKNSINQLPAEEQAAALQKFNEDWASVMAEKIQIPFKFELTTADIGLGDTAAEDRRNNISITVLAALLPILKDGNAQ